MKRTGIFYGSTTGTTEAVARLIAEKMGVEKADIHDVSSLNPSRTLSGLFAAAKGVATQQSPIKSTYWVIIMALTISNWLLHNLTGKYPPITNISSRINPV